MEIGIPWRWHKREKSRKIGCRTCMCALEVIVPPLAIVGMGSRNRQCSRRYSCTHNGGQARSPVRLRCHEHLGIITASPARRCLARIQDELTAWLLPRLDGMRTLEQHAATRWCKKGCRTLYQLHGEEDHDGDALPERRGSAHPSSGLASENYHLCRLS